MNLTPKEWQTIHNGLTVAAERFDEHAKTMRGFAGEDKHSSYVRLAEQFDQQAKDSRAIAEKIADSEEYVG